MVTEAEHFFIVVFHFPCFALFLTNWSLYVESIPRCKIPICSYFNLTILLRFFKFYGCVWSSACPVEQFYVCVLVLVILISKAPFGNPENTRERK